MQNVLQVTSIEIIKGLNGLFGIAKELRLGKVNFYRYSPLPKHLPEVLEIVGDEPLLQRMKVGHRFIFILEAHKGDWNLCTLC